VQLGRAELVAARMSASRTAELGHIERKGEKAQVGRGQGLLGGSSAGPKAQLCLCFKLDIFPEAFL
jgi:hypothetical protein